MSHSDSTVVQPQQFDVFFDDLRAVAAPALRHRLRLSFEADADRVDADAVIDHLLASVPLEAP